MPTYRSIRDISREEWLDALELNPSDIPDCVIVEGSWWRAQRTEWRLSYLDEARELKFPDMYMGKWKDKKVAFCCAYGAPRTVEVIHIFSKLGVKLAVQIGTCGGLQPHLKTGDIILPKVAFCREGVGQMYGAADAAEGSMEWIDASQKILQAKGHTTYIGSHVTWSSLFTESPQMIEAWHNAGLLSVEMETATTFAVARYFNVPAVSLIVVWDDLLRGKRFLDPLSAEDQKNLDAANTAVFETALALTETL